MRNIRLAALAAMLGASAIPLDHFKAPGAPNPPAPPKPVKRDKLGIRDPERWAKAQAKRERRQQRNLKQ